jgi:hypothetical protein
MKAAVVTTFLVTSLAHAELFQPVEGEIEGVIMLNGTPAEDALITSCSDGRVPSDSSCTKFISVRTDAAGRFSFRQNTGRHVGGAEREEQRRFFRDYRGVLESPRIQFGFRVDYQGLAGEFLYIGMGSGPKRVDVDCDLKDLLRMAKLMGVRPVAAPGRMLEFDCAFKIPAEEAAE